MEDKYKKTLLELKGKPNSVILNPILVPLKEAREFFEPLGYSLDESGFELYHFYQHFVRDYLVRNQPFRPTRVFPPWMGQPVCYSLTSCPRYER